MKYIRKGIDIFLKRQSISSQKPQFTAINEKEARKATVVLNAHYKKQQERRAKAKHEEFMG